MQPNLLVGCIMDECIFFTLFVNIYLNIKIRLLVNIGYKYSHSLLFLFDVWCRMCVHCNYLCKYCTAICKIIVLFVANSCEKSYYYSTLCHVNISLHMNPKGPYCIITFMNRLSESVQMAHTIIFKQPSHFDWKYLYIFCYLCWKWYSILSQSSLRHIVINKLFFVSFKESSCTSCPF